MAVVVVVSPEQKIASKLRILHCCVVYYSTVSSSPLHQYTWKKQTVKYRLAWEVSKEIYGHENSKIMCSFAKKKKKLYNENILMLVVLFLISIQF